MQRKIDGPHLDRWTLQRAATPLPLPLHPRPTTPPGSAGSSGPECGKDSGFTQGVVLNPLQWKHLPDPQLRVDACEQQDAAAQ